MEKHLMAIPQPMYRMQPMRVCLLRIEGMFIPSKARIHISNMAHEGYSVPSVCFQCPKASCMEACPTGAILRSRGVWRAVVAKKCDGCGNCVSACPYGMIEQYASGIEHANATLCGGAPACVTECHYGALVFKETNRTSLNCRKDQMKQRSKSGETDEKRRALAVDMLKGAVRVPRSRVYGLKKKATNVDLIFLIEISAKRRSAHMPRTITSVPLKNSFSHARRV